jgi:hypothetical protein
MKCRSRLFALTFVFSLIGLQIAIVTPALAWCIINCSPSEADGQSALESSLAGRFPGAKAIYVASFKKTNGMAVGDAYSMKYSATVFFPFGFSSPALLNGGLTSAGSQLRTDASIKELIMLNGFRHVGGKLIYTSPVELKAQDMPMFAVDGMLTLRKSENGWVGSIGMN